MIGCDHCEEWYHGDCINVTEKEAKYIKKFYCKECREKNSHLSIVYKSKYNEKQKEQEEKMKRKEQKEQREKEKKKKKEKIRERDRSRSREKEKERHKDKHKEKERHKDKDLEKERHKHKHRDKDREKERLKEKEKYREKEKDNEKEKEREKEADKQKSKLKVEELKEAPKVDDKPVSSTSSNMLTLTDINDEKVALKDKDEKYKIKKIEKIEKIQDDDKVKKIEQAQHKRLEEIRRERTNSTEKKESSDKSRKVLAAKEVENIKRESSEDEWQPSITSSTVNQQPTKQLKEKVSVKRKASKDTREPKKKRAWRNADYSSDESDAERVTDMTPRQCYGMDCVNCARIGSKYCSDQCGLSLASLRIYQTLPERIREWNLTSCKAAETNQKNLVKIRNELGSWKLKLEEVDRKVEKNEQVIAKGKSLAPIENNSEDSSDDDDQDEQRGGVINCISCGKDVSTKVAIRHMESCFNKFESQTSYGSMYKTKIEGYQMVCDFYNPQTDTYCKRLRVICPEHTKDPKIGDNEVCGFPLTKDIFTPTGEFCRVKKKECNAHFCWEKLRRGMLDMERVRCWMKLDELMDQERQEKESLSRRAGVLNLMLHSTFNHEIMEKVMKMQKGKQGGGGREDGQHQTHVRDRQLPSHGRDISHTSHGKEVHGEHHHRKQERQPVAVVTLS